MGKINADWHKVHPMPKNPSEAERAAWHYQHAHHCTCRAVSPSIARLLEEHGYELPPTTGGSAEHAKH